MKQILLGILVISILWVMIANRREKKRAQRAAAVPRRKPFEQVVQELDEQYGIKVHGINPGEVHSANDLFRVVHSILTFLADKNAELLEAGTYKTKPEYFVKIAVDGKQFTFRQRSDQKYIDEENLIDGLDEVARALFPQYGFEILQQYGTFVIMGEHAKMKAARKAGYPVMRRIFAAD